jgi:hypothetical protein
MATLKSETQVAVGLSDGIVLILTSTAVDINVVAEGKFRDLGGIWAVCPVNNDNELAVGCISGLYIVQII